MKSVFPEFISTYSFHKQSRSVFHQLKMTGIRRLYKEMSRNDNRDPSYDLERNQTLTILLSSKIKRNQLERDSPQKNQRLRKASKDNNKQKGKTKAVKKEEPPPSSKMVSAINAYKSDSQQSKTRIKKGKK